MAWERACTALAGQVLTLLALGPTITVFNPFLLAG